MTMTLEQFEHLAKYHDWEFMFSDDGDAYRRGRAMQDQLVDFANEGGDEFKKIFNAYQKKIFPNDKPYFKVEE